ncbi:MAG: PfkB family carbohydrate kinase [Puniceicoccaceae bacterium]
MNTNKGKTKRLVIFGEVLFDIFPDGRSVLGGASFNVAWSLNGFGRKPVFVSSVGSDTNGAAIREQMEAWEMDCGGLQTDPVHLTGEVRVRIDNDEPSYEICAKRAWDFINDEQYAAEGLLYHGLLALRSPVSHTTLQRMIERSPAQRFFDINLRPPYTDLAVMKKWLHSTHWLKLNIDELRSLVEETGITLENCKDAIDQLRETYSIGNVVLTGGASGAVLHGDYGHAACLPAPQPDPFIDTVGAGDAFSAATIEGILRGLPAEEIVTTASRFAAKVCGLRGATTTDRSFYTAVY